MRHFEQNHNVNYLLSGEYFAMQKGITQGIEQGMQQGKYDAKREAAKLMLLEGISVALVKKITQLTDDELSNLV